MMLCDGWWWWVKIHKDDEIMGEFIGGWGIQEWATMSKNWKRPLQYQYGLHEHTKLINKQLLAKVLPMYACLCVCVCVQPGNSCPLFVIWVVIQTLAYIYEVGLVIETTVGCSQGRLGCIEDKLGWVEIFLSRLIWVGFWKKNYFNPNQIAMSWVGQVLIHSNFQIFFSQK